MLAKHPDKCRFPHGHTRKVEFVLEAPGLDGNDMVCDFKVVKDLMNGFLEGYDHALCMNTEDPQYTTFKAAYGDRIIGFVQTDPTTEALAKVIFDEMQRRLADYAKSGSVQYPVGAGVRLARVRVWETSSSWAEYEE